MDNLIYLGAAYSAFWAVIFGFFWRLQRREKSLRAEIEALQERLDKEGEAGAS